MSTVTPDASQTPFTEFIDDFFAECDEHLTLVRRRLLDMEQFVQHGSVDRGLLDDLFRAFHSLKGLAAMVGVSAVEQLAHHMEGYLRQLRQGQAPFSSDALETLIDGTRTLEQAVAARRASAPAPEIGQISARLAALAARSSAPAAPAPAHAPSADEQEQLAGAAARGDQVWQISFVPSPALAERSINVNTVRARLQALCQLIRAAPRVTGAGGIAFEFLVAGRLDQATLDAWSVDGVSYAPYAPVAEAVATAPTTASASSSLPSAPATIIRVDLARLDDLMQQVGELIVSRARLEEQIGGLAAHAPMAEWRALQETGQQIERQLRSMRAAVMRVRMVPIGDAFARMQFVVRDLAHDLGKQVALELSGQQTEIDKYVVDRMLDPLLHLVRNAISHGLEAPAERVAGGKPATGKIALRALAAGDLVTIEIDDDGRGIDAAQVVSRARELKLLGDEVALEQADVLELLCAPGFSTRTQADRVSGRGVGMDVVWNTVHELGGTLALTTRPGQGTRFTIQVPLTISIVDALIVMAGGRRFAVPLPTVREIIRFETSEITPLERNELLLYRGAALPLIRIARRFRLPTAGQQHLYACVIDNGHGPVGLVVERLLGKREIVVRPITDPLAQVVGVAGATELADGEIVLILDTAALTRAGR